MSVSTTIGQTPPHSWGDLIPWPSRVRIAVVTGLFLLVYWGSMRHHLAGRWLNDGNWSHGWLIPVFSLYFLWTRRGELLRCRPQPSYVGAVILALSLALYFVAAWRLRMTYPQALSIVGALFGVTLLLGGWSVIRVAWFPILFLVLAVPLPTRLYVELTMPLRQLASTAAAALMPLFASGLHTEAQGVVIDYTMRGATGTLNVEEACSGMRLMMAFVTLGVAMAYLGERPLWQRLVMIASCLPIAVFCNTIRVTTTGLLYVFGDVTHGVLKALKIGAVRDLAHGTPHQLLGLLMLLLALGLFALIGYVLSRLFIEEPEEPASAAREAAGGGV